MNLKSIAKLVAPLAAAIALVSCGSPTAEDAGSNPNGQQSAISEMDFASLLKRTDHVVACAT